MSAKYESVFSPIYCKKKSHPYTVIGYLVSELNYITLETCILKGYNLKQNEILTTDLT